MIKQRKFLIALAMSLQCLLATPIVRASSDEPTPSTGDAILLELYEDSFRKRMPSRNFLQLSYSDGLLSLASYTYEGEFTIQLDNVETGETVVIPSIFVGESINIELPCGIYNVSLTGSDSLSFYGYLEIS